MPGRSIARFCVGAALAVSLAACGTEVDLRQINLVPKMENPFGTSKLTFLGSSDALTRPVTADDLINAQGQCVLPQAVSRSAS